MIAVFRRHRQVSDFINDQQMRLAQLRQFLIAGRFLLGFLKHVHKRGGREKQHGMPFFQCLAPQPDRQVRLTHALHKPPLMALSLSDAQPFRSSDASNFISRSQPPPLFKTLGGIFGQPGGIKWILHRVSKE